MATLISLDFKRERYRMINIGEVDLVDCLEDAGGDIPFAPSVVVFGSGWTFELGGEEAMLCLARLTSDAFDRVSPYLFAGGVTVRMVFTLACGTTSAGQVGEAQVQVSFLDNAKTAGWSMRGAGLPDPVGSDAIFRVEVGDWAGDLQFDPEGDGATITTGRHGLAVAFNTEEMRYSIDGGDVATDPAVPDEFTLEQVLVNVGAATLTDGTATATLELLEFLAVPTGSGEVLPTLPELSDPNPDGTGDGLVDDSVRMRCWSFSLDGHDFAVFRGGPSWSLPYDLTTGTWSQWASPGLDYWRAHIGLNWLGAGPGVIALGSDVICGDDSSGTLFVLDPTYGRDDRSTTSSDYFERVVTGGIAVSGRDTVPCGAVTVDCSVGEPTQTDAAMTLEISDDFGHSFTDCGSITTVDGERDTVVEWRALGTIKAPGRVFRFTDTGATVRFAAANLR
jgi:hypothetical protein